MRPVFRTFAMLLTLAALPLAAQGPRHRFGPGMGQGMGPGFACLDLTDAQKASLKAIHEKHQSTLQAGRTAAFEARKALRTAMMDPATSDSALKAAYDQASSARFVMLQEHRAMLQESLAVLTPDQKAKWDKKRADRLQWMQEHAGRRGMGGPMN